ncbi:Plant cysteine oxidase 1 [Striga hermonthica]|uniref:cysteine dioxygenase n=1 Tax=Striga hermonthica TaxID=68872 RepID=A0A9N7MZY3_STRHE|nr:Plant cysteine oxidase 1 [Striga hermonthica]
MSVEAANLVERFERQDKVKVMGVVHNKVVKKKRCRRKVRIQLREPARMASTTLQELFDCCKHAFKGPGTVPSPADVQRLQLIIDCMKPEDVGLSKDLQFFKPKTEVEGTTPRVTSATIHKCQNFELCIFFIPAKGVIPLHNHPEMTVFSKLLLGTMHIKAYDWVDSPSKFDNRSLTRSKLRLAKLKANKTFTAPCDTSVLYPTSGGNIHEIRALTPCAVLDVIGPPYSKEDGRDGSFYKEATYDTLSNVESTRKVEDVGGCYRWLEEIEIPKESEMDGIVYMGPQITKPSSY